jgi:uncharacterized protein YfdQ (DUF2303 family)
MSYNELRATTANRTEADAVAELAQESARYGQTYDPHGDRAITFDVLRSDERVHVDSMERYASKPDRRRGTTTVTAVDSFALLLARPEHEESVIFADETRQSLTAVIDYTGWRDHRIILQMMLSDQFTRWKKSNGDYVAQTTFAEFIQDSAADIVNPTAADMLELAQSFQATKSVDFTSSNRISNGQVQLSYRETIDAQAGNAGQLEVPEQFTLHIPIWRGGAVVEVKAALRYRIEHQQLRIGYKILHLDDLMRAAFEHVTDEIASKLDTGHGHELVFGPAPAVIEPLK